MPIFLILSEIYGRKVTKWWKIRNFLELFGPPCRNALADLDGSTPECAQVCALHIGPHLASLREIEMVAVRSTKETTPHFWVFNSPRPPGADGPHRGRGHVDRHCPYTDNIWCGSVHALMRYRSKTAKMQKFPIDSHSNENFICPFFRPPEAANPQKGRRDIWNQSTPHANFGVNRPAGCREIVDRTNKQTTTKNIQ